MSTINKSRELDAVIHDPEEFRSRSRSPLFFAVAVLAGLAVTALLLGGYFYLRSRHAAQTLASEQQQQQSAPARQAAPPEVKIFEDQAMIKGAQVIVGGTVQNITSVPLTDLSLELELTRRADGTTASRTIALAPKDLAPGEQGRYSLTVLSREFKRARILRVQSGARAGVEVAFATAPGNQRPAGPPQTNSTIIVNRPAPRSANGDFINTPDNPTTIR